MKKDRLTAAPLRTCEEVMRYPDRVSFWIDPVGGSGPRFVKDAVRYDFQAWLVAPVLKQSKD